MGQHSKQVIVLADLGERTTKHDGKIILIEAEVAAAKEIYGSPAMQDVKLWDLSEAILQALQSKDKENGTTLASGVTSFDVEQMLL